MNIEEMDFSPHYYGIENRTKRLNVSQDECDFFCCTLPHRAPKDSLAYDYFYKLGVYINRFGNPMPIEIRKDLLRKLKMAKNNEYG